MDMERFIVMSHVRYALNKTKIKGREFLSSLVEVAAMFGAEENDSEGGVWVQKATYCSTKRSPIALKTS
jgi:hypothetical protein